MQSASEQVIELGRFGHHPDPAIDYECEIDDLIGMAYERLTMGGHTDLEERIGKAMDFQVLSRPGELRWLNQVFNAAREIYAVKPAWVAWPEERLAAYTPSPAPMVEQAGELKPCPFCGGEAVRREYDARHPYEPFGLVVDHTDSCFLLTSLDWDSVYTRWNTRPAPAETEGVGGVGLAGHSRETIDAAIKQTDYKYFGDYEMSDKQREAVDVLVDVARARIASTPPADAGMLREALEEAAGWFEQYAVEHYARAKVAPDSREQHSREIKGKTNADRAKHLRAALNSQAHQIREGDHG